jgi:hypothetical protein
MGQILILAVIVALFAAVALAAYEWGSDSRPSIGDDHARQF